MEHRLHRREPVDLMVGLVSGGRVVARVRAIDMSPGGLGIDSSDLALQSGQGVMIDLCKPGHPRGISCSLSAMVIHAGPEITGLMFTHESPLHMLMFGQGTGAV